MLLPRAGCDRDLTEKRSRQYRSFIEIDGHIGRALLLVPTSNTIPRMNICPFANASSVAVLVVIHVSTSPKLFVVFAFWAGFHQLTFHISNYVFFSRWVFGRVAGARCVVLNLDDVLHAMQRDHEWSKLFDDTRVLSAHDP